MKTNQPGRGATGRPLINAKTSSLKNDALLLHCQYLPPVTAIGIIRVVRIGVGIIIWIVRICVIICMGLLTAFRPDYFILKKSNQANGISVSKMIFPSFVSLAVSGFISDQGCSSPQRGHFFLCHVRFNI